MQLLIDWVSQIIVFLLIASIVDLLIPASTLKRYIKLVIGLILILIFLQPVFKILHIDIQQAVQSAYQEVTEASTTDEDMESLIKKQKSDIQASQDAYIVKQLANDLKDLAKEDLKDKHNAEIQDIQFKFSNESSYTYEDLEEVMVTLGDAEQEEGVVSTVENVNIDTEKTKENEEEDNEKMKQIQKLLKRIWEIDDKKVTVLWEGKEP